MILIEPDHINKSLTVSRPQLHPFQLYLARWCDTGENCFNSYVRRRSGPVSSRQGNESARVYGFFISLADMLTFLWVMHQNNGYNNNIFLCHGGKECVRKQPSYIRNTSYFPGLLTNLRRTPYFYYSKVHVVGFRQHFELERPSNCEINR